MKKMSKLLIPAVLAGSLAFGGITAAMAQSAENQNQQQTQQEHKFQHKHKHFKKMFKKLNLTEEQKAQVKTIMKENHNQVKTTREQLKQIREQLKTALINNNFQPNDEVNKLIDQQSSLMKQMMTLRIATSGKIYQILTPEQQAQFKKEMSERPHRR